MADDQVQDAAAAPSFDMDALATSVADKLKESFQAPQPQRYQAPEPQRQTTSDPVAELVDPYVKPHVERAERRAQLAEAAATDAVTFYISHPEIDKAGRLEIEKRFQALKDKGIAFQREDIYNHYQGENIDKVVEQKIKSREEAARRAADAAATVGPGSPDKARTTVDARSMSTEDLEKALDGVSF
jgi:hypothetical protein